LGGRLVFTFPDVLAVYIADPDTRETFTSIECINVAGQAAPRMLILLGVTLLKKHFNNDILHEVTFSVNQETGSGYTNDMLAIDWLEQFKEVTCPRKKTRNRGVIYNRE
jgi:hypothetical protein